MRDEFVAKLDRHIASHVVLACRVCDSEGKAVTWIRRDESAAHFVGGVDDAKGFMRSMIDGGWQIAFIGVQADSGVDVWLTAWEEPEHRPTWPSGIRPLFEEVHEGVFVSAGVRDET